MFDKCYLKALLVLSVCFFAGCSSPPKPAAPSGDSVAVNNESVLSELVRIARQGKPKSLRYVAEKGDTLRDTFDIWTQQADMRLQWRTTTQFKVKADIDAADFKTAVIAFATQLKNESPSLLVEFPNESTVLVRDFIK